ncbi:transporter substrate-binding domain-containing protein [Vibrio profundum]|uniref:substrate-binding periplasmic protein n=1 Tax=Vibrio profundum TaxID=2910247 RepID=UPI003D0D7C9A
MLQQISGRVILALLIIAYLPITHASPRIVKVCDDVGEWPPYTFFKRDNIGEKTSVINGITVEIFNSIFSEETLPIEFSLLPWKRCLKEAKGFSKYNKYEIFNNGISNEWREKYFLRTHALYHTTNGYFYDSLRFPHGLKVQSVTDLNNYTICGVAGHSYDLYVQAGLTRDIDTGAHTNYQALNKMILGRCDVFFTALEPILGAHELGLLPIPETVRYGTLDTPKTTFYSWVSKESPRAEELREIINSGLEKLKKNCRYEGFYRKYLPQGSRLPLEKGC